MPDQPETNDATDIRVTGSACFWIRHQDADWATNDRGYRFAPVSFESISVAAVKHTDRKVEIRIAGPFDSEFAFVTDLPECTPKGLCVVLTWNNGKVTLFLNGKEVETKNIDSPRVQMEGRGFQFADDAGKLLQMAAGFEEAGRTLVAQLLSVGHAARDHLVQCVPAIVCEAFAVELYFKCHHALDHGIPAKHVHDFVDLFDSLLPATQDRLRTVYSQILSNRPHAAEGLPPGASLQFDDVLTTCNSAFKDWRYLHESSGFKLWTGSGLRHALRTVADERYFHMLEAERPSPTSPSH